MHYTVTHSWHIQQNDEKNEWKLWIQQKQKCVFVCCFSQREQLSNWIAFNAGVHSTYTTAVVDGQRNSLIIFSSLFFSFFFCYFCISVELLYCFVVGASSCNVWQKWTPCNLYIFFCLLFDKSWLPPIFLILSSISSIVLSFFTNKIKKKKWKIWFFFGGFSTSIEFLL